MKNSVKEIIVGKTPIGINNKLRGDIKNYLTQLDKVKVEIGIFYINKTNEFTNYLDTSDKNLKEKIKKYGEGISSFLTKSIKEYINSIYGSGVGLASWHNLYSISELVDALIDVYSAAVDTIGYDFTKAPPKEEPSVEESPEEDLSLSPNIVLGMNEKYSEKDKENLQEGIKEIVAKGILTKYSNDFKKNIKILNETFLNSITTENKDKSVEILDKYLKEVLNKHFTIQTSTDKTKGGKNFDVENLEKFKKELLQYSFLKVKYDKIKDSISKFNNFEKLESLRNEGSDRLIITNLEPIVNNKNPEEINFLHRFIFWVRDDRRWHEEWPESGKKPGVNESKIKNLREIILNIMKEEKSKKDKKLFGINRTLGYLLSVADSPKSLYDEISQAEPLLNKKIILSLVKALAKIKKIKDGKAPNNPS